MGVAAGSNSSSDGSSRRRCTAVVESSAGERVVSQGNSGAFIARLE